MTAASREDAGFWLLIHLLTSLGIGAAIGAGICLIRLLTGA